MPPFLSTDWIRALGAALAALPAPDDVAFAPFTVRQTVTAATGSTVGYAVRFAGNGVEVVQGDEGVVGDGDLAFVTDYATAAALNRGELSAQEALEAGRLEVRGRLARVTAARKLLAALGDAARELRATTTYDPTP